MPALLLLSLPPPIRRAFSSVISTDSTPASRPCFVSFGAPFKVTFPRHLSAYSVLAVLPQPADFNRSLCNFLALGVCTINVLLPFQTASAAVSNRWTDETFAVSHLQRFNLHSGQESLVSADDKVLRESFVIEKRDSPFMETIAVAEGPLSLDMSSMPEKPSDLSSSDLFQESFEQTEGSRPFLDYARLLSPAKAAALLNDIDALEAKSGWRLRVITKSGLLATPVSGKDLKDLWKPDEKTVIVIEDISSPNILNFNAGAGVIAKLPRQFFLELQSRYGNQFFVQQEGEGEALTSTVRAIRDCLQRPEGCKNVPGLTNDLYYLTLATSIAGGCVFGFAARLPPSGRVEASWQWVLLLSPLWLLLFVSFGILPVVGRTSELEPLIKNAAGFAVGAFALYLTPIFGPSPISRE